MTPFLNREFQNHCTRFGSEIVRLKFLVVDLINSNARAGINRYPHDIESNH